MSTIAQENVRPGRKGAHLACFRRDRGKPTPAASSVVVRAVNALGVGGAALAAVLVLQGTAAEGRYHQPLSTHLTTATGFLDVGSPSVTLVHEPNEMVGMPNSAAHRSGGEVLLPVTLTNTSHQPLPFAASQFHVLVDGETVEAGGEAAAASPQELRPGAAITLRLTFPDVSLVHGGQLRYEPTSGPAVTAPLAAVAGAPSVATPAAASSGSPVNVADGAHHEHGTH